MAYTNVKSIAPKYFLGSLNLNPKVLGSKVQEIITALNLLGNGTEISAVVLTAGTVSLPSLTFTGDLDNGLYYIGANHYAFAANGAKVLDISTTGLSVTGLVTASTGFVTGGSGLDTAGAGQLSIGPNTATLVKIYPGLVVAGSAGISNSAGGITATTPLTTSPVGTVAITEYSTGKDIVVFLTLTNFIVGSGFTAAALGVGNIVCALPAGVQFWQVCSSSLALTVAGTAVTTEVLGLGTVVATGAVSVLSGTATFQNYQAGYTGGNTSISTVATNGPVAVTAGFGTGIALQTAASIKNVFLNCAATWNTNNTGNLTATGTICIKYTVMV